MEEATKRGGPWGKICAFLLVVAIGVGVAIWDRQNQLLRAEEHRQKYRYHAYERSKCDLKWDCDMQDTNAMIQRGRP